MQRGSECCAPRRHSDAGRGVPRRQIQGRRRRDAYRVAQSVRIQRHQDFQRRRLQAAGRARRADRGDRARPRAGAAVPDGRQRGLRFGCAGCRARLCRPHQKHRSVFARRHEDCHRLRERLREPHREAAFHRAGRGVPMLSDEPNGVNVNDNCGSTHMEHLMTYVKENHLDAGVAFDGDADRCLAVDEKGQLVDGDFVMAICAADMKSRGKLAQNAVVGTIMTNMGFIRFCEENGMKFVATKVGDRYVLEEMQLEGYNFGGEQSGHIIFLDFATTGDGQMTAAQLLSLVHRREAHLSSLATLMTRYPQVMVNVTVKPEGKLRFYTDEEVKRAVEEVKKKLGTSGRIIVRPSGTEPLLRVMVEGEDESYIQALADSVANVIRERLA